MNKNLIDDLVYIKNQFSKITDTKNFEVPSEYIEETRYLNKELTRSPGFYKFKNSPFWKEPLDNLGALSNCNKVVIVKGVQTGATTGILENFMAYNIGSDPKPQLYISADKELVKMGMEIKVERMLDSCNLREKIASQTKGKTNKTGDTTFQKEYPGGFLIAIGAQSPGKLRQMSFPVIMFDELDGMPDQLGREGDPVSLADNRTNAYGDKRKILYISTPLVLQTSKIWPLYERGDQRKYHVPCKYCGEKQELIWHGFDVNGERYGIVFEIADGEPIYETVGYKCKYCHKVMKNYDKALIVPKGEWIATTKSKEPGLVSYHISALYSMPGFFSWENIVVKWANCWDLKKNRMKDKEKYREFRNLMQGLPFEERGESIRADKVKSNRSYHYLKNQINNYRAQIDSGSEILLLVCSVDVQKNNLFVDVKGYTEGGRSYTIDFFEIDGPTEDFNSIVWQQLDKLLLEKIWTDEKGQEYRIIHTVIDSGKYTEYVYNYCKGYATGVCAIKGDEDLTGGITFKPFTTTLTKSIGVSIAYHVNTTKLKDFIARAFNLQWNTNEFQPEWFPNFPQDMRDDYFKMFEAEYKKDIYDKVTNKYKNTRWIQGSAANHAFDTYVYNLACLEMVADYACRNILNLNALSWDKFWNYAKTGAYFTKK